MHRFKIPGFEFKPNCPPESLEKAINWLTEVAPTKVNAAKPSDDRFNYVASFAEISGGSDIPHYNEACHAFLGCRAGPDCVAFWCKGPDKSYWHRWYKWFSEESFASEFILYTNENGVVVSSDIPAAVMHSIAMLSRSARQMTEGYFHLFNDHLDWGTPPEVAYLAVFGSCNTDHSARYYPSSDHRPWASGSIESYKRFVNGNIHISKSYMVFFRHTRNQHCSGFLDSGDIVKEIFEVPDFKERLSAFRKAATGGEEYRPPNPFARKTEAIPYGTVSVQEYHEVLIPYCLEKGLFNDDK